MNKLPMEREGEGQNSQTFVYIDCERPLSGVIVVCFLCMRKFNPNFYHVKPYKRVFTRSMPTSFVQSIVETDGPSNKCLLEVKQHNGNPSQALFRKIA